MARELGPVDYVVVELPAGASSVDRDVRVELAGLVDNHLVRVLDLLVVSRRADGTVAVAEFEDSDLDELGSLGSSMLELLSLEDIENLAMAISPGDPVSPSSGSTSAPRRSSRRWPRPAVTSPLTAEYLNEPSSHRCVPPRSRRERPRHRLRYNRFCSLARSTASRRDDTPNLR